MLKKLPLHIRLTLIASLFLLLSCIALTLVSNWSAANLVQAITLTPAVSADLAASTPAFPLEPSRPIGAHYHVFQQKTAIATALIVLIGSVATYFAARSVLRPIRDLSREVRTRTIENLDEPIVLPGGADEIQQLTASFHQMMTDLHRSFRLQREFSANAAHELRTPLAIMRAKLDVFSLEAAPSAETQQMVDTLSRQLERLSKLIEDLLWFSQDVPLAPVQSVPLHPLLCDVADELSELSAGKDLTVHIEPTAACVRGQDRLLERVFYNLLENAIKYSPPHTQVTVHVREQAGCVQVCVADQGEGIPEACRQTIFQPFFRVDRSRSRAIGGSGLGLAVCKRILDRHQAQILVRPNQPRGSIFELTFRA